MKREHFRGIRRVLAISSLVMVISAASCGAGSNGDGGVSDPAAPDAGDGRDASASPGTNAPNAPNQPNANMDPGPPAVRFVGRFDARDPSGPSFAWPGGRILANFDGTEVSVTFHELVDSWMLGGPSEWDVAIDGEWKPKLVLATGKNEYTLASGLSAGPHRVELFKRSEAQNGVTQFLGFDFGGGKLLPPPLAAVRHIEVVGDSTPAGYGVEGAAIGPNCPAPSWAAHWENFHEAFSARLGEIFSADVVGTAYSGKGIVKNVNRPDTMTVPRIFPLMNPLDPTSTFDFASWTPDLVVIMAGSNDYAVGEPVDDGPPPFAEFIAGLRGLVAQIRSHYPNSYVLYAISPSVTDDDPPGRGSRTNLTTAMTMLAEDSVKAGDARFMTAAPAPATPDEVTGCNGHGTPAFHERVAHQLAEVISAKMGW